MKLDHKAQLFQTLHGNQGKFRRYTEYNKTTEKESYGEGKR